ncbi:hypothetical protein ABT186_02745 [Streptomyces sp. NPDC001634]
MKVLELDPGRHVLWEVVDGPEEWIATHVDWGLDQVDDYTVVLFKHQGWKQPVEFMHHCSTKWAVLLRKRIIRGRAPSHNGPENRRTTPETLGPCVTRGRLSRSSHGVVDF